MKNIPVSLTKSETIWGIGYLIFQILFLPAILSIAIMLLHLDSSLAKANFVYYCINLLAILVIFRKFLLQNLDIAAARPGLVVRSVLFGLARYMILTTIAGALVLQLAPDFMNANDAAINGMVEDNLPLMALGTIVLVPPAEECLFRGLVFRNLYDKSRALAYIVSTVSFAAIHLLGYLGVYTPTELLAAFIQYVPAGLCLGWAYERSGTILAPIFIHAIVNTMGIYAMRGI